MFDFTNSWGWPQWLVLGFWALSLMVHAVKSGESRVDEKYNPLARAIGITVFAVALAKGGFFS